MTDLATHALETEKALDRLARAGSRAGEEPISEDLYGTFRDLAVSARHLVEISGHLSTGLAARVELGQLRLDVNGDARHPPPGAAVAAAQMALAEAATAARVLADALTEARHITSTIADTGNLAQGTCRCGHDHTDHDGEHSEGRCLVSHRDPGTDEWISCGCTHYREAP